MFLYLYLTIGFYAFTVVLVEIYFFYIIFSYIHRKIKEYVPKPKVKFQERSKPKYGLNESWHSDERKEGPHNESLI